MYYIWFDESDKEGAYYSNFYGGILVDSKNYENVLAMSKTFVEEFGITEEIKWQKVNEYWYEKYLTLVDLKIMLDDIPLKGEDKKEFKKFIYGLNYDKGFQKANIHIRESDICEIDSSEHLMLQFMDLILGSICFRLNNKHKIKDGTTNRRGKRTIVKEKLYKYINSKIRELHPGFNIWESTGISQIEERWTLPYSHWSFKPSNYVRDTSKAKK